MSVDRSSPPPEPGRLLGSVATALARPDADDPLTAILRVAADELEADGAAVFARDPDRVELELTASVGRAPTSPGEATIAAAVRGDATLGRPAVVQGTEGTAADLPLVVGRSGIEHGLGAVTFWWTGPGPRSSAHALELAAFADLVAVALDRWRLATLADVRVDRDERLAMMDGLTGLANARTLDRVLELELARAARQDGSVSVAVFDIDDFATLNERGGRAAGDAALREVAAALAGSVRLVDTVARTGADEFVVVAPGSAGRTVAARIAEAVAAIPGDDGRHVTVSAGVAHFPVDGAMPDTLLAAARAALGQARAAGGGRIAGGDPLETR